MKIKWLGHAAFLITADDGTRVITDPYEPAGQLTYAPISESADIVTVSHEHGDHNNTAAVKGNPVVIRSTDSKTVKGVEVRGVATFHDNVKGAQRGENLVFCITVDGVRVVHLGDLGHALDAGKLKEIGPVDILIVPVGGFFTIDGRTASQAADGLKPAVVIPMHFRTARCTFPIKDAKPFLKERSNVRTVDGSEEAFAKDSLPKTTETVVLKPAL